MKAILLLTFAMALPSCDSPAEKRQHLLLKAADLERRGMPYEAIRTLQTGLDLDPRCLPFSERILDIYLNLEDCAAAAARLPGVSASRDWAVFAARTEIVCGQSHGALERAWKQGHSRHPALLRQLGTLEIEDGRGAYRFVRLLQTIEAERDTATVQAWTSALPTLSWRLKSYLAVAGLLSPERRAAEGPP